MASILPTRAPSGTSSTTLKLYMVRVKAGRCTTPLYTLISTRAGVSDTRPPLSVPWTCSWNMRLVPGGNGFTSEMVPETRTTSSVEDALGDTTHNKRSTKCLYDKTNDVNGTGKTLPETWTTSSVGDALGDTTHNKRSKQFVYKTNNVNGTGKTLPA